MIKEAKNHLEQKKSKCLSVKNACYQLRKKIEEKSRCHLNLKEEIRSLSENISILQSQQKKKKGELDKVTLSILQYESKQNSLQSLKENLISSLKDQVGSSDSKNLQYSFKKVNVVKKINSQHTQTDFIFVADKGRISPSGFIFYGGSEANASQSIFTEIDVLARQIAELQTQKQTIKTVISEQEKKLSHHEAHLSQLNKKHNDEDQSLYADKKTTRVN